MGCLAPGKAVPLDDSLKTAPFRPAGNIYLVADMKDLFQGYLLAKFIFIKVAHPKFANVIITGTVGSFEVTGLGTIHP
jgi:hypothetical protein